MNWIQRPVVSGFCSLRTVPKPPWVSRRKWPRVDCPTVSEGQIDLSLNLNYRAPDGSTVMVLDQTLTFPDGVPGCLTQSLATTMHWPRCLAFAAMRKMHMIVTVFVSQMKTKMGFATNWKCWDAQTQTHAIGLQTTRKKMAHVSTRVMRPIATGIAW